MKIAVIADSHDNLSNFKKVTFWLNREKIRLLLHCGDICAPSTLREGLENFSGKTHIVFGNVDGDQYRITKIAYEEFPNRMVIHGEWGEIKINGKKIAFSHSPDFARGLALTQKYDLVFYGHTHKPWEETLHQSKLGTGQEIGKIRLVNPGNLAGLFFKPTFAVYDTKTDKLELKILEKI